MLRRKPRALLALLCLLASSLTAAVPARGQLVRWLRLNPEHLNAVQVAVEMHLGTRSARVVAFQRTRRSSIASARFVGSSGELRLENAITDQQPGLISLNITLLSQGPGWVAIDLEREVREWPFQRWRAFLEAEGLTELAGAKIAGARVRVESRVYLKALVHRGSTDRDQAVTRPVGQPLELVPRADPVGLSGNVLPVLLLHHGRPLAGAIVHAAATEAPSEWQGTTDAKGEALVPLPSVGTYVLTATVLLPAQAGSGLDASFESSTVTLQRR